ncbi:MAG: hypothetical protein ACI88A_003005 [Paraglaciecola sp.]|jgi:hypothetical protein
MKFVFLICILVAGVFSGSKSAFAISNHVKQELIIAGGSSSHLKEEVIIDDYFTDAQKGLLTNNIQQVMLNQGENKTNQTEASHYMISVFPYLFYALFVIGLLVSLSLDEKKLSIDKRKQYQAD